MPHLYRAAQLLFGASLAFLLGILLLWPCSPHDHHTYPENDSCHQHRDPNSMESDRPISFNGNYNDSDRRYEELRVRLERTARRVPDVAKEDAREISRLLVSDLRELWRLDGRAEQRRQLAERTAALVQRRLWFLQNPRDCRAARRLACPLIKCGFGCQVHHAVYCLIVAYATQRTLVFSRKTLSYDRISWDEVFQPVSNTCGHLGGKQGASSAGGRDRLVATLEAARGFLAHTSFQPPAVPADLLPTIRLFHGAPHAWWVGQVVRYLLRPRRATIIQDAFSRLNFTTPIVGIHVRRGDKLIHEAKYHSVDEYMTAVEDFYETMELSKGAGVRRIYVATDDIRVFEEINEKYPDYTVIGDREVSSKANSTKHYSKEALDGILVDVLLLSRCDFIVCTFSSNVCRLVYELMQTLHTDASMRVTSLDYDYGFVGKKNLRLYRAISQHLARTTEEMNLNRGDIIAMTFYNETSNYGHNLNTSESGYFPIFKTVEDAKPVPFPTYTYV